MSEKKPPVSVRIKSSADRYDTLITDGDGKPLEHVTRAAWRQSGGGPSLVTLEMFSPEMDVVGELVDLERLAAAEATCHQLIVLLNVLRQEPEPPRRLAGTMADFYQGPGRHGVILRAVEALNEWRRQCGQEPMEFKRSTPDAKEA